MYGYFLHNKANICIKENVGVNYVLFFVFSKNQQMNFSLLILYNVYFYSKNYFYQFTRGYVEND